LLSLSIALGLLAPAGAHAGKSEDFLAVYKAYQAAGGVVDGCKFSAKKLASAKAGVPPDIETYAPDFPGSLDAALRKRASGDCEKAPAKKATQGSTTPPAAGGSAPGAAPPTAAAPGAPAPQGGAPSAATTTTPAPAPDFAAAPAASDGSVATAASRNARATAADDAPLPLVLLAVLTGLAGLAGLIWALGRFFAFDPSWLAAGRHATSEAGWRASASWAEFTDWVRLGR
jgi:hypothetical protein